jgi:sugar phosphate isomerase/epimerase
MENVRNNTNLEKIVNGIKNVKVCFDLGHAHAYANETQLFEKFKDEIQCSHLHNNFGKDTHNALSNGEINYKIFLEKLSKIENSSNCLECFISQDTPVTLQDFVNFVKMCYHDISNV